MKTNPNFDTNAPPFESRGCKAVFGVHLVSRGCNLLFIPNFPENLFENGFFCLNRRIITKTNTFIQKRSKFALIVFLIDVAGFSLIKKITHKIHSMPRFIEIAFCVDC